MALAMGAAIVPPWNSSADGWFSTRHGHRDVGVRHRGEGHEPGVDGRPAGLGRPGLARHLHPGDPGRDAGAVRAVDHREHQVGELAAVPADVAVSHGFGLIGLYDLVLGVGHLCSTCGVMMTPPSAMAAAPGPS